MALASKPVDLQTKHLTKQELSERKEQEQKLKGNDSLVYIIPTNLSAKEKKVYKFLIDELKASEILNNLDINILVTTANAIVMMEDCKKLIKAHGLVTVKEDGSLIRNPASVIYKDYIAIFNKGMQELGMSPSSRARLSILSINKQKEKEDPLLKVINGGANGN